tara:strand:+ start:144 stop:368 length:225 start_codon:yes stop_codon:yes gene_type:complete
MNKELWAIDMFDPIKENSWEKKRDALVKDYINYIEECIAENKQEELFEFILMGFGFDKLSTTEIEQRFLQRKIK